MTVYNKRSPFQTALIFCIFAALFLFALHSFLISRKFDHFDAETIRKIWKKKTELTRQKYEMSDKEKRLFEKLESIHKSCGEVCNTKVTGSAGKVNKF